MKLNESYGQGGDEGAFYFILFLNPPGSCSHVFLLMSSFLTMSRSSSGGAGRRQHGGGRGSAGLSSG